MLNRRELIKLGLNGGSGVLLHSTTRSRSLNRASDRSRLSSVPSATS